MKICFSVIATVRLGNGFSARDAEIRREEIGGHEFEVIAESAQEAPERALDEFHSGVAIGVLDFVQIDTEVGKSDAAATT